MVRWSCSVKLFRYWLRRWRIFRPRIHRIALAVGRVMVRRDASRFTPADLEQAPQEAARRVLVPVFAQHRVEKFTVPVDGAIEVAPPDPATFTYVSSRYHETPAFPRRLRRSWSASRGAKRNSHARIVSWVTSTPRGSSSSATSRKLRL